MYSIELFSQYDTWKINFLYPSFWMTENAITLLGLNFIFFFYLLLMMQSWASLSRSWACETCSDNSSGESHPGEPSVLSSWEPTRQTCWFRKAQTLCTRTGTLQRSKDTLHKRKRELDYAETERKEGQDTWFCHTQLFKCS